MAGYIGSKTSVTQVDGYNRTEADDEFVSKDGDTITTAGTTLTLDRTGSEGTILDLKKDGSTVGSIGAFGGTTVIDSGSSYSGLGFDGSVIYPRKARATADGTVDLGASNARWKDLYLSGGVFLGGTGSANHLDEVEEGTYVPDLILSGYGTIAGDTNYGGHYIKIKDSVWFNVYCRWDISSRTGVTETKISLPFTSASTSQNYSAIYVSYVSQMLQSTGTNLLGGYVNDNSSTLRLHLFRDNTEVTISDTYLTTSPSAGIMVSGYYRAA